MMEKIIFFLGLKIDLYTARWSNEEKGSRFSSLHHHYLKSLMFTWDIRNWNGSLHTNLKGFLEQWIIQIIWLTFIFIILFFFFFCPSRIASISSVSVSVCGACQLPLSWWQPAHTRVQQWWGAFAVRHPSESDRVSYNPEPGQNNRQFFSLSFTSFLVFSLASSQCSWCSCHCRRWGGRMLVRISVT